jgi:hypothetical protein
MYTGAHTLDRSPATLAYDDARRVWGDFYANGFALGYKDKAAVVEDVLITNHGQHLVQARFVAQTALSSVIEHAQLKKMTEQAQIERIGGIE